MRKLFITLLSALSIFAGAFVISQSSLIASAETDDINDAEIVAFDASSETVYMSYYGQYTFGNGVISNANISSDISFYCDGVHYKGLKNVFGSTNYTLYFIKDDNTNVKVYDCVINTSKGTWVNTKYKTIYSVSEGTPTNISYFTMTKTAPSLNATYSGNTVSWQAVPYATKYYVYDNQGTKITETTATSTNVNTCGTYYVTAISSSSRQIVRSADVTLSHSYTKQAIKGRAENIVSGDIHVCTEEVVAYYLCANCDDIGTETFVYREAGTHTYGSWQTVTPATCTTAGTRKQECSECGAVETESIPATGVHSYGSWTVDKSATCTVAGSRKRTCTVCGKSETQAIPATGHNYGAYVTAREAYCKVDGLKVRTCSACGDRDEEVIHSIGYHDYTAKVANLQYLSGNWGDCQHATYMYYSCARCGDVDYDHTWVYKEAGEHNFEHEHLDPTCTVNGYDNVVCTVCHVSKSSQTLPPLGHNYVNRICTRCGAEADGYIVTYYVDNVIYFTETFEKNELISFPENPSKRGYSFGGWMYYDADGEYVKLSRYQTVQDDMNVYAHFEGVYTIVKIKDTVTNKVNVVKVLEGYTLNESYKTVSHTGYKFLGYTRDGAGIKWNVNDPITEDLSLTANYEITFLGQVLDLVSSISIWTIVIAIVAVVIVLVIVNKSKNKKRRRRR